MVKLEIFDGLFLQKNASQASTIIQGSVQVLLSFYIAF